MSREPKSVICKVCGARVRTTQALNGHMRFRHDRKPKVQSSSQMDIIKVEILGKVLRHEEGWEKEALQAWLREWLGR